MKSYGSLFLLLGVVVTNSLFSAELTPPKQEMIRNLDSLQSIIQATYAPKAWKTKFSGWELDAQVMAAKKQVADAEKIGVKEYQKIVRQLFLSMKDYHVGIRFHSTESGRLPFTVKRVGERYFIAFVDRTKVSESGFPFDEGDELISFGGRKPHAVVSEIKSTMGANTEETDWALATSYLTSRSGKSAMQVEKGPIVLTLIRKGTTKEVKHQLIWEYTPEKITSPMSFAWNAPTSNLLDRQMVFGDYDIVKSMELKENPHAIGAKQSFVPALGKKEWETEKIEPFHAYIYKTESGKTVGYVRIPSYSYAESSVAHFAELMHKFQNETDALVIDEIDNPGGSVFYLYALASMLTDTAFSTPRHAMSITQADVVNASELADKLKEITNDDQAQKLLGPSLQGYPMSYQVVLFIRNYADFIVEQWQKGNRLTEPGYIFGADYINPHEAVRYTKPVLMLTNELDFSGGDFFPAILQDNKRITILGTRTAGAGGYVTQATLPNAFGIATFSLTGSLAERLNLQPIENLGVTPDINYELTVDDVQNGYKGYGAAINKAVESIIK